LFQGSYPNANVAQVASGSAFRAARPPKISAFSYSAHWISQPVRRTAKIGGSSCSCIGRTKGGLNAPLALPNYWLDYKNAILILNFTLPFKHPVKTKHLKIEIYDPTIFVDFGFAKGSAVRLVDPPAGCKLKVIRPQDISVSQSQRLGEQFFNALAAAQNFGAQFAKVVLVDCP